MVSDQSKLQDEGDSPSESTRDGGGTTLNTREQGIQDPLSSKERVASSLLLGDGSRRSHRPELHHRVLLLLALELRLKHDILPVSSRCSVMKRLADLDRVRALFGDSGYRTHRSRRKHNLVVVDQRVFIDATEDVSSGNVVSDLELRRVEVPLDLSVKRLGVDTSCTGSAFAFVS
jgi:hypothetical protein